MSVLKNKPQQSLVLLDKNQRKITVGCRVFNHTNKSYFVVTNDMISEICKLYKNQDKAFFKYLEVMLEN